MQVYAQLSAQLTPQVYENPIAPKVGQAVEVIGSHSHLLISDVDGVGSVALSLNQSMHQIGTSRPLQL